jgi:serine/threonine-protein kinase
MTETPEGVAPEGAWTAAVPEPSSDPLRLLCEADGLFRQRYEGWHEVGRGTAAAVVRTHQRDAGLPVALKVVWRLSPGERRQMRTEAQALMSVQHPAVLRTYALFDRGTLAWLEMELVEGATLDEELRAARASGVRWPQERALEVGACLAEGLAAVHAAGFVHRDVKPGNVLVPREGPAAKLADFGVARATDATVLISEGLAGSPRYASPEALEGQPAGAASDVYALALTLYELFTGGLNPYGLGESATLAEVLHCHRSRAPLALRVLERDLPPEVADVVHAGLDKRPGRRPSAGAIASVLRGARGRAGTGCGATEGRGRGVGWLAWLLGGFLGLLCVGGGVVIRV